MNCANIHTCKTPKRLVFIKGEYQIVECENCKLRFTNPMASYEKHIEKVYDDNYFFGGEDGYPDYFQEKDLLIKQGEHYANTISKYIPSGSMLDIGAAAGFFMKGFENSGWQVNGIEPNKTMTDYALNELNLNIIQDSFETHDFSEHYNLVTLIQVIGHFYDLSSSLRKIPTLVRENGFALVESWDMNSLIAKLLGKNWHEYSPPSVLNWFSKSSLQKAFEDVGFEHIKSGHPNKKISLNHALTLFDHKYPSLQFGTRVIEKIIGTKQINIPYPPLDVFWMLFKKV